MYRSHSLRFALVTLGLTMLMVGTLAATAPSAAARLDATMSLDPEVGPPHTATIAKGAGFAPGEVVAFYFDAPRIGSVLANRLGKFKKKLGVPASAQPGDHVVVAVGQSSGLRAESHFLVRTDWLQGCFQGGRSCFNPYENVLNRRDVHELARAWTTAVGTGGLSSPVYASGHLFIGGSEGMTGIDPATGAIIINYVAGPVKTTPAVIRGFDPQPDPPGKVLFAPEGGTMYAIDSAKGALLWKVAVGASPTSPLVVQGPKDPSAIVLVGSGQTMEAFDQDGVPLWSAAMEGGDISKSGAVMIGEVNERVVVPAGNTLQALDATTGEELWSVAPSRFALGAASIGDPSIIGDPHILVGDATGAVYSIDPVDGAVLDTFTARGPVTASPTIGDPNVRGPWVFVGDGGGNIYAFDTTDEFPPPIWTAALGGPIDGPPVLANGVLYALTDPDRGDPVLYALSSATGAVLFQAKLEGGAAAAPTVADGMVVIGIRTGDLVAYEGPDS